MVTFFAVALEGVDDDRQWKIVARVTALLAVFAIVLSGTRSAMIGLIIGGLVFAAIARPRFDRRLLLTGAACAAALGMLYVAPARRKLRARVHWSLDHVRGGP